MKQVGQMSLFAGVAAIWLLSSLFILSTEGIPLPKPWEPYTPEEQELDFRQARIFHDTLFSGLDVAFASLIIYSFQAYCFN